MNSIDKLRKIHTESLFDFTNKQAEYEDQFAKSDIIDILDNLLHTLKQRSVINNTTLFSDTSIANVSIANTLTQISNFASMALSKEFANIASKTFIPTSNALSWVDSALSEEKEELTEEVYVEPKKELIICYMHQPTNYEDPLLLTERDFDFTKVVKSTINESNNESNNESKIKKTEIEIENEIVVDGLNKYSNLLLTCIPWKNKNVILAGGFLLNYLTDNDIHYNDDLIDIDIFLYGDIENKRKTIYDIFGALNKFIKSHGYEYYKVGIYGATITIFIPGCPRILQIIMTGNDTPEDVVECFDFTILHSYYNGYNIKSNSYVEELLKNKTTDIVSTTPRLYRILKYMNKGIKFNGDELFEMGDLTVDKYGLTLLLRENFQRKIYEETNNLQFTGDQDIDTIITKYFGYENIYDKTNIFDTIEELNEFNWTVSFTTNINQDKLQLIKERASKIVDIDESNTSNKHIKSNESKVHSSNTPHKLPNYGPIYRCVKELISSDEEIELTKQSNTVKLSSYGPPAKLSIFGNNSQSYGPSVIDSSINTNFITNLYRNFFA